MPGSSTELGKQVSKIAAIMGGNPRSAASMLKAGASLSEALNGFTGDPRDLKLGHSGRGAARVFHDEIMKDEAGFKRRLQDLAEALPSGSAKVHPRKDAGGREGHLLREGPAEGWSRAARRRRAAAAHVVREGRRGEPRLRRGHQRRSEGSWVASEHDRGIKKVADGDKLKELAETLVSSGKSRQVGPAAETPAEGMTSLANLISTETPALDGILQEVRRMQSHGKNKRPSHANVGAN